MGWAASGGPALIRLQFLLPTPQGSMNVGFIGLIIFLVVGILIGAVGFNEWGGERVARVARIVFYLFVAVVIFGLIFGLMTDAARVAE